MRNNVPKSHTLLIQDAIWEDAALFLLIVANSSSNEEAQASIALPLRFSELGPLREAEIHRIRQSGARKRGPTLQSSPIAKRQQRRALSLIQGGGLADPKDQQVAPIMLQRPKPLRPQQIHASLKNGMQAFLPLSPIRGFFHPNTEKGIMYRSVAHALYCILHQHYSGDLLPGKPACAWSHCSQIIQFTHSSDQTRFESHLPRLLYNIYLAQITQHPVLLQCLLRTRLRPIALVHVDPLLGIGLSHPGQSAVQSR